MEKKLSIIIPCYNEESFIYTILNNILESSLPNTISKELIVVNDGSTDNSMKLIEDFKNIHPGCDMMIVNHPVNKGKGSCIKTGIQYATGDYIIIQDADLEYDPKDYNKMLSLFLENRADVVYGSRFRTGDAHRVLFFMHTIGNKFLTFLCNLFTQLNLTDMECGYKMFRSEILKNIQLHEQRFGFEPEVTSKISRIKNIRIYEIGISYHGRTYADGKKIKWQDGFRALYCIIKYNLFVRK